MRVIGKDGSAIGTIEDTFSHGAGDILEIALPGRDNTALILLSDDGILEINRKKGYVKIDNDYLLES